MDCVVSRIIIVLILTVITTVWSSTPQFILNHQSGGITPSRTCGLSSDTDHWSLGGFFLKNDEPNRWRSVVNMTTTDKQGITTEVCTIDISRCDSGQGASRDYCYCSSVNSGLYNLKLRQYARAKISGLNLTANLQPASGNTDRPISFQVATLPVMFDPYAAYIQINNEKQQKLLENERVEVLANNVTTFKFCVYKLLHPTYTVYIKVGDVENEKTGANCVSATESIVGYDFFDLTFSFRETAGCSRFYAFKGIAKYNGPTVTVEDTKFENLETTYGIMLAVMAAIFIVCCVVAWYWYCNTKRKLKMTREHEIQGALDFDKFDSRMEDSHI